MSNVDVALSQYMEAWEWGAMSVSTGAEFPGRGRVAYDDGRRAWHAAQAQERERLLLADFEANVVPERFRKIMQRWRPCDNCGLPGRPLIIGGEKCSHPEHRASTPRSCVIWYDRTLIDEAVAWLNTNPAGACQCEKRR